MLTFIFDVNVKVMCVASNPVVMVVDFGSIASLSLSERMLQVIRLYMFSCFLR